VKSASINKTQHSNTASQVTNSCSTSLDGSLYWTFFRKQVIQRLKSPTQSYFTSGSAIAEEPCKCSISWNLVSCFITA